MKTIQFRDFIILQRGFDLPKHSRDEGEYPVIAATGIHGSHSEFKVNPPGVVTGRSGSLGEVVFVERPYWPLNTTLWVKDFKENQPRYVYYFLKTLDLKRFNSGAGVPTLNRNHLDTLVVKIHDRQNQQKIASILSAYDDLIENNLRRIKISEEMAQTIYREWFVKFRFPGHQKVKMVNSPLGKIPEGWEIKRLGELVETQYGYTESAQETRIGPKFLRGTDINKNPYVDWENVPYCPISKEEYPKFKLGVDDIVVIRMADPGKVAIVEVGIDAVFASYLVRLKISNKFITPYYLFYFLLSETYQGYISGASTGTTRKSASAGVIVGIDILIPPKSILEKFQSAVLPLRKMLNNLLAKNAVLRQTRDLLLPKLISGELDASELEITIPEANA